jgi:RNA-directed DNA polymerase
LGNLTTPNSVQKLQMALHAKAKAEAGYRFYALYDKISREDILAHAYAQCRSNKGAPGVDGQEFADIEAYGVQRWLGELALAQAGDLPTGPHQKSVHTEGQRQTQAVGHLDPA